MSETELRQRTENGGGGGSGGGSGGGGGGGSGGSSDKKNEAGAFSVPLISKVRVAFYKIQRICSLKNCLKFFYYSSVLRNHLSNIKELEKGNFLFQPIWVNAQFFFLSFTLSSFSYLRTKFTLLSFKTTSWHPSLNMVIWSISLSCELHKDSCPLWASKPTNSIIFNETEKGSAIVHFEIR